MNFDQISYIVIVIVLFITGVVLGGFGSCIKSDGVFLPNFHCVNKSKLDYCLYNDLIIPKPETMPVINFTLNEVKE